MNPIKVLLVIEVRLIANLFASVLEDEPGMEIAGIVSTVEDATAFLQRQPVDVALVNADLPDHQALKFTQSTMECSRSTKVVVLGLSEENQLAVYIPPGFAHGFCVLSDLADVLYKCTALYAPEHERTLLWNDPTVNVHWPLAKPAIVSGKDLAGLSFGDAETFS